MKPQLVIGMTGGIGSGKSAATAYLAEKGITIVDADIIARQVVEPGQPALQEIVSQFGDGILHSDGQLNRRALRDRVFNDPTARQQLEAITHPRIRETIITALAHSESVYTILVSPLLLESGQSALTNRVLLIDSDEALQIARAAKRDGVSADDITRIMNTQWGREQRRALADDVVENNGNLESLYHSLDELHRCYLDLAHER